MSTANPYLVAPSKSSGGRYQSVMTLFVNSCELPRLQKPKEKKKKWEEKAGICECRKK
jgi:hypothetical protein